MRNSYFRYRKSSIFCNDLGSRHNLRRFSFQVTPEFTVDIVMGIEAKLSILKPEPCKVLTYFYPMRSTRITENRYHSPEN